ncbi:alpha/beta fold hydrolase, partial [Streptomyces sp. NPDC058171]
DPAGRDEERGDRTMIEERHYTVRGVRTRVLVAGAPEAPPILLLHDGGWGASADMSWERMIPIFAQDRRVIAPDLIGFGGTDKIYNFAASTVTVQVEHMLALLDELGIISVPFVGSSFGGTMTIRALTDPNYRRRISAAVTLGGTGGPWKTPKAPAELTRFDGTREDMQRLVRLLGIDDQDSDYVDRRLAWSHVPGHYETMSAPRLTVPDAIRRNVPVNDFPKSLRGVDIPTLIIHGVEDDLLESDWGEHLASELTDARIEILPSGHCPNVTMPEKTAEVIHTFLTDCAC